MTSAPKNIKKVIRLKSYSTIGEHSFIEIFEMGYRSSIESNNIIYVEKILQLDEIHQLINHREFNENERIPDWLNINDENILLSISQRLLCIVIPLIEIRKKYNLDYRVSVYLNSVMPVIQEAGEITNLFKEKDEIIVNTRFSAQLLKSFAISKINIYINPPIPQLCKENVPVRIDYRIKEKSKIEVSTFSRVIPEKQIHSIIKGLTYLDESYVLNIYGFQNEGNEYEIYLKRLITENNLTSRIKCLPMLKTNMEKIYAFNKTDIFVNLSTTFEETMGKTILESCYWGKEVIANEWNGFPEILPKEKLINTYWSKNDWYHVKPCELSLKIKKIKFNNSKLNLAYYENFYESVKNQKYMTYRHRSNTEKTDKNSLNIDKEKLKTIVESHFAPNLIKRHENNLVPEHPYYIYTKLREKAGKLSIQEKLMSWINMNTNSAYRYTAMQIYDKLQIEINLEKEGSE